MARGFKRSFSKYRIEQSRPPSSRLDDWCPTRRGLVGITCLTHSTIFILEKGPNVKPMKRVYYFCPPEHALSNLQNRHLKVSRFSKCNDPFELASFSQKNSGIRRRFREWLAYMDKQNGLLCFCRTWRNPLMWAHYAKNHTGICYGFDVDPATFVDVKYVSERLYPNLTLENFFEHVSEEEMVDLFATKFIQWGYEEEVRLLVTFSEDVSTSDLIFHPFSDSMILKEVIVGPKSTIRANEITPIVGTKGVEVIKSRLAFQRFEVVDQKNRSLWQDL